MDYVRRAVRGMLYADDACIVSRSPQGLAKMMEVIVEVPSLHANRVGEEDRDHVYALTAYTADDGTSRSSRANLQTSAFLHLRVEAAGQAYKQVQSFTYLGDAVTETPDMSVEIARRTCACWMRIRRYLRELYDDQPKIAPSLKIRMVKAEAIEALLYGCSTWTLRQEHHAKVRTVHSARNQTIG